jgi:hypothetical protein
MQPYFYRKNDLRTQLLVLLQNDVKIEKYVNKTDQRQLTRDRTNQTKKQNKTNTKEAKVEINK